MHLHRQEQIHDPLQIVWSCLVRWATKTTKTFKYITSLQSMLYQIRFFQKRFSRFILKGKATLKENNIKMKAILFPNILIQVS